MIRPSLGFTLALALLAMGCAPHVQLTVPPQNASSSERLAAYQQLAPVALSQTVITHYNQYGGYAGTEVHTNHLQLRGGMLVAYAEDLVPAVLPGSATDRFAASAARNRRGARRSWYVAAAFSLAGFATIMSSISSIDATTSSDAVFMRRLSLGSALTGVGLVAMLPAKIFGMRANRDRHAAFLAFDSDLSARLGFCEDARGQVVDCGAPTEIPIPLGASIPSGYR